eukprot:m.22854 g.22854  ORF g.22854 m.22854 type:complete len:223 (-) comp8906_c0_seq1:160-828(-)
MMRTMFIVAALVACLFVAGASAQYDIKSLSLSVSCPTLSISDDTDVDAMEAKADLEDALSRCKKLTTFSILDAEIIASDRVRFDFQTKRHARRYNRCINKAAKNGSPLSSGSCTISSSSVLESGCAYATVDYEVEVDMNQFRVDNLSELPLNKFLKAMKAFGRAALVACSVNECDLNIWNKGSAVISAPNKFIFQGTGGFETCLETIQLNKWFDVVDVVSAP